MDFSKYMMSHIIYAYIYIKLNSIKAALDSIMTGMDHKTTVLEVSAVGLPWLKHFRGQYYIDKSFVSGLLAIGKLTAT